MQVPGLPLLNIRNLVRTSGSPNEDHDQPGWHSLWTRSHYSGAVWKRGNRQYNISSLIPIRGGNVHQVPMDDVYGGLKNMSAKPSMVF